MYASGEIATDEGDGEGRMVWRDEGVASVLRGERKTLREQAGKGEDENEQRVERNWCWKYRLRYRIYE